MRAGTILLRGLDESLGKGPRRRTNEDTRAAEGRQTPLSRAVSAKPHTAAENLWCQVSLLNSVQVSIAISDAARMSMCARFIMSARISGVGLP
jgi:hypothetical protein